MNATMPLPFDVDDLVPRPITLPFYYSTRPSVVPWLSDIWLSLLAPVVAYWAYSLLFHFVDAYDLFPSGRIHESEEVARRNKATPAQVVWAVVVQHVVQTVVGFTFLSMEAPDIEPTPAEAMRNIAGPVSRTLLLVLGEARALPLLRAYGPQLVSWVYWWGIPTAQLIFGMLVMDTWEYVVHRGMHQNKFLYRHFHSVHHRLYVPYSYGALYNHPLEGFVMDTCGGAVSQYVAGLSIRQAALFFALGTMKTVDDHCGYRIPFDPFQLFFANTADYHDIHHQHAGIKSNFSQPFFIHWDRILGTRMTREQFSGLKKQKALPEKEL